MNRTDHEHTPAAALADAVARVTARLGDETLSAAERDEIITEAAAATEHLDLALRDLAGDPDVPAAMLGILALSADRWCCVAVAGNASTSTETLDVLLLEAGAGDTHLYLALAANPNTHPDSLEYLLSGDVLFQFATSEPLLRALATNPATGPVTLSGVAVASNNANIGVLAAVALHPNTAPALRTSPDVVEALAATQGGAQAPDSVPDGMETAAWARVATISYDHTPADSVDVAVAPGQRLGDAFRDALGEPTATVHVDAAGRFRSWTLDSALDVDGFRFLAGHVVDIEAALEPDRGLDL